MASSILEAYGTPCVTCGRPDAEPVKNGRRPNGTQIYRPQCRDCDCERRRNAALPRLKTKPIINGRGHSRSTVKTCTKCMKVLPMEQFSLAGVRDGVVRRAARCKACQAPRYAASYRADPEGKWRRTIAAKYNITPERYEEIGERQGWMCAVCATPAVELNQRLHIDHDHSCCPGETDVCGRCVRGLLCGACNRALGMFQEDVDILVAAATYLLQTTDALSEV